MGNLQLFRKLKVTHRTRLIIYALTIISIVLLLASSKKVDDHIPAIDYGNWTENSELVSKVLRTDPFALNKTYSNLSSGVEVLFIVLSAAEEFITRSDIRETWANPVKTNIFSINKNAVLFLVGRHELYDHKIQQEHKVYKDILQVDIEDTYSNLVYKLLAAFKWATISFPNVTLVKVDSDVVVRPEHVIELIKENSNHSRLQIGCSINYYVRVSRDYRSRWFISNRSYSPEFLPNYCSGPLYILFPSSFTMLWEEIKNHKVFEVEDAFITGVLADAAGIPLLEFDNFLVTNPHLWNCNPEPVGLLTHKMGVRNIRNAFKKLQHFSCLSSRLSLFDFFMT